MDAPQYKSIEYSFRDHRLYGDYYSMKSIGWEYWAEPAAYFRDCRKTSEKLCVFQRTVSGEGTLLSSKKTYAIAPGEAFLIEKPGQYQYYRSPGVPLWEFQFISLNMSCLNIWNDIKSRFGTIVKIPKDSQVMQCWQEIYQTALRNEMDSYYTASGCAYQFMMQLYNTLIQQSKLQHSTDIVQRCVALIQAEYRNPLDIKYLSNACGVSISCLSKRFREAMNDSPIRYLNRYRIEMACALLLRGELRVDEVAHEVGYSDANYFTRVFKKSMGLSPKEYQRQEVTRVIEDHTLQLQIPPSILDGR